MSMKATAKTHWVWTQEAHDRWEQIKKDGNLETDEVRIPGTPVYEYHRQCCPRIWVEKGYVREA